MNSIPLDSIGAKAFGSKDSLGVRSVKESVSRDYSSIVHKDCDRTNLKSPQEFIVKRSVPRFALLVFLHEITIDATMRFIII